MTILLPGPQVAQAFLCRMPLEGTVAENVLKHGCGGLDIDGCRVGTTKRVPGGLSRTAGTSLCGSKDGSLRHETGQEGGHNPNLGRWPTNLLLVHGPGCKRVGEREISVNASRWKHYTDLPKTHSNTSQDAWTKESFMTSGVSHDADGHETVAAWECAPGCPVRALDEMSGVRKSGLLDGAHHKRSTAKGWSGPFQDDIGGPAARGVFGGDAGTASRFYPQFTSLDEALSWLARLATQGAQG